MQILTVPQPPTLNQMINKARSNKFAAAKDKKYWTNAVAKIALEQLEPIEGEFYVVGYFDYKTTASDADNLFATLKYILDGLVTAEIIEGDSVKYLKSPTLLYTRKISTKEQKTVTIELFNCPVEFHNTLNNAARELI